MKSIFLMGVFNEKTNKWYTVTKVGNGFDDKTLEKLQKSIDMVEIKKNQNLVPDWLVVNKQLTPDFVVKDAKKAPVWELTGAEFSKSDVHTADGISIRFPRVTRVRDDKSWKEATSLERLKTLFKISKEKSDIVSGDEEESDSKTAKASKKSTLKRKSGASSDDEEDASPKKKKAEVKIPKKQENGSFPSIFEDKTFYLSKNVEKASEIKRYIVTYDGELVDDKQIGDATHIILSSADEKLPDSCPKGITKMTDKNFWNCVKHKKFSID